MDLKKVEILNFKSYKGSYIIGPFDRFTSIIGPNGSGKSNILDAITFGFNVPSSTLRVSNLKELISYGRNEASVKIHISDLVFERMLIKQDGRETKIESIFKINSNRVSQKEYNSKLNEINIIAKIKNFVIYQGDIIKTDTNLLNMIEVITGSDEVVKEYKSYEEQLHMLNREVANKYEMRKDCLGALKEIKETQEKERVFGELIVNRDLVQRQIYAIEIKDKKTAIKKIENTIKEHKNKKEKENYLIKSKEVDEIRKLAAKMQKEYFEKESEMIFRKNRKGVDNSKLESELEGLGNEEKILLQEMETNSINSIKDISGSINIFNLETKDEENALCELTLKNFDKINKRDALCIKSKQTNNKIIKLAQRQNEEQSDLKLLNEKQKTIDQEVNDLESKISNKSSIYDQIINDENIKNNELNLLMRDILLNKAKKSDLSKRTLISSVINNLKSIFSGVHGKVIDLIEPIQKRYELPVGVLLSSYDHAVVVDNEQVALDCLKYLKETKACRLTFLPLSKIVTQANHTESDEYLNARNAISYNPIYRSIVDFIFSNALIVDTIDIARKLLYKENFQYKICTLNGVLLSPNGLITGGKESNNKFEDNIIDSLLNKRKAVLDDLKMIKDRKDIYADIGIIKDRIAALKETKCAIQENFNTKYDKEGKGVLHEILFLEKERSSCERELDLLNKELSDFEENRKIITSKIKEKERMILGEELHKIGFATLSEYKEAVKNNEKKAQRRMEIEVKLEAVQEEICEISKQLKEDEGSYTNDTLNVKELDELHAKLENTKRELKIQSNIQRSLNEEAMRIQKIILNNELIKTKMEDELKDLIQYASVEYDMDNSSIENTLINIQQLKENLEIINTKLNEHIPTVVSADTSIQAKYAKLNREYETAKNAASEIKKKFMEVKEERMNKFNSCFLKLNDDISRIYKLLSGEVGNAYIVYEGDPFTNNLKYYLMPPNKRFTEFANLSGGEKSIALLTFIFALNKYRQAPFYIFDEVDSALDKINVEKLSNYLVNEQEQFIVISLKSRLYQYSDSLIGVYKCPSEHRSKILSLRLN